MGKRLFTYFSLAYLISWTVWLPMWAPGLGLPLVVPAKHQHAIGGFGPMLAALIMSYRRGGIKQLGTLLLNTLIPSRFVLLFVALLSPLIIALGAAFIRYIQTGVFPVLSGLGHSNEFPDSGLLQVFFYNFIFFGLGEETGWRGFALPALQSRYSALVASSLLTLFWAIWHWPLFLYRPGYLEMGAAGITGWSLSLFTGSILLTWLFNSSRGSVFICAVFHATVDIAFTSDLGDNNLSGLMGMLITLWGIAIVIITGTARLSKISKVTDEMNE